MARLYIASTSATSTGSPRQAFRTLPLLSQEPLTVTSGIADQALDLRRYQLGTIPTDDLQLQQTVICVRMKNRREFSTIGVLHQQLDGIRVLPLIRRTLISRNDESHPRSARAHFHGRCGSQVSLKLRSRDRRQVRRHSFNQRAFEIGNSTHWIALLPNSAAPSTPQGINRIRQQQKCLKDKKWVKSNSSRVANPSVIEDDVDQRKEQRPSDLISQ